MAINPNWPFVVTQVAFNVGGNDNSVAPVWTELTPRVREFECSRGRQYEIDQNQAGEGSVVFSDRDEYLNPANGASPYAGNLVPYRMILDQAMWPPAPIGGANNLMNAAAGYDPGFEATAVGATPPQMLTFSTSPTVSATNPWQGTHSLTWSVLGNGSAQYVGFPVLVIPNRTYTVSCYVRQSAANSTKLFLNNAPGNMTTTTAGAYVRLSFTFTATQPVHQVYIGSVAPTLASTCYTDGWQLEDGSSVSTWSATGPTVYGVFRGFVERWPKSWTHNGLYGMCKAALVDPLAVLANTKLSTEVGNVFTWIKPDYYWRLDEGDGRVFADKSGNNGPSLVALDSTFGPAETYEPGTTGRTPGDPGKPVVKISTPQVPGVQPATVLQTGQTYAPSLTPPISVGGAPPFGYTIAMVMTRPQPGGPDYGRVLTLAGNNFNQRLAEWFINSPPSAPTFSMFAGPGSGLSLGVSAAYDYWCDDLPHIYVMTVAVDATNFVITGYIDGSSIGTQTLLTSAFDSPITATQIQVGGLVADINAGDWTGEINQGVLNAEYSHLGIWRRVLSAYEIAVLKDGVKGYPNENSGARVQRYLGYKFNGLYGASYGMSSMGISDLADGTALLDACQYVAGSENGNFVANASGTVLFTSRADRYLNTTADWVFGEQELPYEGDITFDFDPQRVANTVKIERTGGITATATDDASAKAYFPREFSRKINVNGDAEAVDASNWLLALFKDPHLRVEQITLNPATNPALWPVALGVAIGDRVTVKRRAISGGVTMSLDFFVEKISHSRAKGKWTVQLQLSPALGRTPWLLQDPTYGQLGVTTVLAY